MVKLSKRFKQAHELVDLEKAYELSDAVSALYRVPVAKFNETIEVAAHLSVDPRQSDQMVRGTVHLPHGSGKTVRVVVFTEKPQEALDAGADVAGLEDILKQIQDGWLDFDVAVSTPAAMKQVRTVARVLGPRGLMPNPKSGTVTDDVASAIQAVKAGRVEFKMDKTANLHVVVGKRSFDEKQIEENIQAAMDAIAKARPSALKGRYIKNLRICSTMGPGIQLDAKHFAKL